MMPAYMDYDDLMEAVSDILAEAEEMLYEEGPYPEWESVLASLIARIRYGMPEPECMREALGVLVEAMNMAGAPLDVVDRLEDALGLLEQH